MTDIPPTATEIAPQNRWNRAGAFRSIALSIVINAVMPYLIYRLLEPRFPHDSLMPLLASTVFPLIGLLFSLIRKRSVDIIAIISLVELGISILVTLVSSNVEYALIARALQGTLTGVFFLVTVLIGRPLLFYIARQFMAASAPEVRAGFEAAHVLDKGRIFGRLTALWGVVTIVVSIVNVWMAAHVAPATYLLAAPILGIGSNIVTIIITIHYASSSFGRIAEKMRASQNPT